MRPLPRLARAFHQAERAAATPPAFRAENVCGKFPQQLAFVLDASRYKVACCSRRAGKTIACAVVLLLGALAFPDSEHLYLTLSRVSGKRIVWKKLLKLNRDFQLGGVPNRSELTLTFPNGATIYIAGAKDEAEIEKYRGPAYKTVVIDEAQAFREHIRELIDDVVTPTIIETKGTVILIGTPGRTRYGYFHEACLAAPKDLLERLNLKPANDNAKPPEPAEEGEPEEESVFAEAEWSVHHWTIRDNPFIADVDDELAKLRKRKRWSAQHPTYQREYLGRWVTEHEALVYKYDPTKNSYDPSTLPGDFFDGPEWLMVSGVDQGYHDADALGTLAYRRDQPWVWLLPDETVIRREGSKALVAHALARWEKYKGRTVGYVWDTGGGGKKSAVDAQAEGVPVEAAEKDEKVTAIDNVNDDLAAGVLRIPMNSQAAADAARVTWDPKARGVKIAGKYHTDIWDVIVYARRRIGHDVLSMEEWNRRQAIENDPAVKEAAQLKARTEARLAALAAQQGKKRGARGLL